jgi:hypothetical protein
MGCLKEGIHQGLVEETLSVILQNHGVTPGQNLQGLAEDGIPFFLGESVGFFAIHANQLLLTCENAGFSNRWEFVGTAYSGNADFSMTKKVEELMTGLILTDSAA